MDCKLQQNDYCKNFLNKKKKGGGDIVVFTSFEP